MEQERVPIQVIDWRAASCDRNTRVPVMTTFVSIVMPESRICVSRGHDLQRQLRRIDVQESIAGRTRLP
jgi:hypothetical protein